jgi:hypothetical protein
MLFARKTEESSQIVRINLRVIRFALPIIVDGGTLLVAQLVEALCYKPEGRGIDFRWLHWTFSLP